MAVAEGIARVVDDSGGAKLKVRFAPAWLSWLPFVWGDYWVLDLTEDYSAAMRFVREVDTAVVYVNASTQFTDGAQFGLGAEIIDSTQKTIARGPVGLREITTYKWVVLGDGQTRP